MRKLAAALFCLTCLMALKSRIHAQSYLYATGNPSFSTQIPIENGFINVNNGEIHIEIPLAQHPQRGKLQLNERLIYDSRIWKIVQNSGYSWQPTNVPNSMGGWQFVSGAEAVGGVAYSYYSGTQNCIGGGVWTYHENWGFTWTDPQGTKHLFDAPGTIQYSTVGSPQCTNPPSSNTPNSSGRATDGSGYTVQITNYTQATIFDKQGNQYNAGNGAVVQDANGNYWSRDGNSNLVDTLGRTPVLVSTSGKNIYYDVLTYGGARARYTVTTETVNYHTAFGQSAVSEASGSFTAIQSIQLPDGSEYSFTYDSGTAAGNYGELTSVTLPQGGVIQYGYTNFLDSFQNQNRWLHTRVKDGGTTTFVPATISNCTSSTGCQEKTTVTSPTGNDTVYTFTLDKGSYLNADSWNTGIDVFQGSSTSGGTKIQSSTTSYSYSTGGYNYPTQNGGSAVLGTYDIPTGYTTTTTLPSIGLTTQVQTSLDYLGNPSAMKQWDYYTGSAPANPTLETDYQYYWGVNGAELPTQVVVKDGSGNPISKINYAYDETTGTGHAALVTTSGLSNHNSVSGARGNLTTVTKQIDSSGATLSTEATYDDAGTLLTQTDPNGTTTYGHDSTDTFVTITTPPTPSSGVGLATSASYDFSTGLLNSTIDPNGTQAQYRSYDAFGRVGEIDNLDGSSNTVGKHVYTYYSSQDMGADDYQNSSTNASTRTLSDSYGRHSRTAIANGQSSNPWYQQDTCYDANGNVNFQSYSYQGNGWATAKVCSGSGDTYSYDALGRVKTITHADGTSIQYNYNGRATKVTDENGVSRITQVDGLGRPTIVCEISSSPLQGDSPVSCGTDITGYTGYLTNYSYDLANHKTTITQGAQTRVFQTDWLGRTIFTQEPERGTTSYTYAYNSTGLVVTRKRPKANQTNSSVSTTTTTQYDSIGRPVSITYDDGTPAKSFYYDQASSWGVSLTNSKGHLTTSTGGAGEVFMYDAMGRPTTMIQCLPSHCGDGAYNRTTSVTYDWLGNELTASDGAWVTTTYTYSPANEVQSITSSATPPTLVSSIQNGPFGPTTWTYGNGLKGVALYDPQGRHTGQWVCNGSTSYNCTGGSEIWGYWILNRADRVIESCDDGIGPCANIGYDDLGRMTARNPVSGTQGQYTYGYDRYGNRWQQNAVNGGATLLLSFDKTTNRINSTGYVYDAAGNLMSVSTAGVIHTFTYDAEGNLTQVDGGNTAKYTYNALNQRVRIDQGGVAREYVFNPQGQRTTIWDGQTTALDQGQAYWGSLPLEYYANGAHFQHRDWLGTLRALTVGNGANSGAVEDTFTSLPFGDGYLAVNGFDPDPYHFAQLDKDYYDSADSNTDHAQFRQYSDTDGRWMSPDPYDGSYDPSNPQSFNRYSYALNDPLSMTDPTGMNGDNPISLGGAVGGCAGAAMSEGGNVFADIGCGLSIFKDILGLFGGPSFHGSLHPRPAGTGNPQWDGNFGESLGISTKIRMGSWGIAQALGLPDAECEFGSCGGIGSIASSFTQGAAIAAPLTWCGEHPTICTAGADLAAFVRAIPAVTASVLLLRMEGDGPATAPGVDRAACYEQYERDLDVCRKNHKRSCYAQAMERYSACLAGKSAPPFNF